MQDHPKAWPIALKLASRALAEDARVCVPSGAQSPVLRHRDRSHSRGRRSLPDQSDADRQLRGSRERSSVIDQFTTVFSQYIDSGFGLLGPEVGFLTKTLIGIDVALAGLFWAMGGEEDIIARLSKKSSISAPSPSSSTTSIASRRSSSARSPAWGSRPRVRGSPNPVPAARPLAPWASRPASPS